MEKKKKTQKRKQRRVLLLLFFMIGTGIIFGTATYAWFTANKTVSVNPIDVNVTAKSGLQISADAQNWKSILDVSDLTSASGTYTAAVNQIPATIEPVSSVGTVDSTGKMEMFLGTVTADDGGDFVLSASKSTETNTTASGAFVAYDIFLRTEEAAQIYLTSNSGITFADDNDKGIKNATRVAFVVLGNKDSGESVSSLQSINDGAASPVTIWEPNYDDHTAYGVANARDVYGVTVNPGTGNAAVTYDGIKAAFGTEEGITLGQAKHDGTSTGSNNATLFQTVTPAIKTETGFDENQALINLEKGVTKVRVYMWIEGQDVDCENNASGGKITFDLQLTTATE